MRPKSRHLGKTEVLRQGGKLKDWSEPSHDKENERGQPQTNLLKIGLVFVIVEQPNFCECRARDLTPLRQYNGEIHEEPDI
ncbi:MAG: hypothetical protein EGQ88_00610 [Prevotellamassilia timonensis]|nr:hypothetical protein [Prevotellamassilia timonensis]